MIQCTLLPSSSADGLAVQVLSPASLCWETCAVPVSDVCLVEIFVMSLGLGGAPFAVVRPTSPARVPPMLMPSLDSTSASLPFYCPCHIQHLHLLSLSCVPGLSFHGDLLHIALVWKSLPTASRRAVMIMFCGCYHWRSACSGLLPCFTHFLSD